MSAFLFAYFIKPADKKISMKGNYNDKATSHWATSKEKANGDKTQTRKVWIPPSALNLKYASLCFFGGSDLHFQFIGVAVLL